MMIARGEMRVGLAFECFGFATSKRADKEWKNSSIRLQHAAKDTS
jgi:hypothetical protein